MATPSRFENEERNILQVLVKYGDKLFFYADAENQQPVTVGDYILEERSAISYCSENRLHAKILEEYKNNAQKNGFVSERYFLHHSNEEISLLDCRPDDVGKIHSE